MDNIGDDNEILLKFIEESDDSHADKDYNPLPDMSYSSG